MRLDLSGPHFESLTGKREYFCESGPDKSKRMVESLPPVALPLPRAHRLGGAPARGGAPLGPDFGGRQGGAARARSHCCFVLPLIHFIPDSLTYTVPLFL
jgi:hypothetical protein